MGFPFTVLIASAAQAPCAIGLATTRASGERTKIAVSSNQPGIDPVGSCIGERGSRINRIIEELNGEKIDIIPFDKNAETFIKNALSPAREVSVFITDEKEKQALQLFRKKLQRASG